MTVLRYILQNPMKAGLENSLGIYRWSSYLAYKTGQGTLTDTEFAIHLFGNREILIEFVNQSNEDTVMDEQDHDWRLRDDSAKAIMQRITQCESIEEFQLLDQSTRKDYVRRLYQEKLSMSQISKLTGVSKATISRTVQLKKLEAEEMEAPLLSEPGIPLYLVNSDIIW